ncbi:hypothetical protein FF38_14512 [Lucilia cuprina]|uniref:Uncharacterized protein n=1 Tax=Lucilia cuprina TaxID=7375 RepID=A0A0L0CFH6_LUCCU|nr:hypothetical protein FF38_14512 [Lucilia cuprina]
MVMDQLLQHLSNGLLSVASAQRLAPPLNATLTNILPSTSALNLYAATTAASNLRVPPWAPSLQLPHQVNSVIYTTRQRLLNSSSAETADSVLFHACSPIGAAQQHPPKVIATAVLPFSTSIFKAQFAANTLPLVAADPRQQQQRQQPQQQPQQPQAKLNINLPKTNLQHAKHNAVPQGPPAADGNESNDDDANACYLIIWQIKICLNLVHYINRMSIQPPRSMPQLNTRAKVIYLVESLQCHLYPATKIEPYNHRKPVQNTIVLLEETFV